MRGNDKVHKDLSEALKAELTAINQYFLHGKMCDNWGYFRLGGHYRKESIEEMVHAEKLMDRILFLDGTPNMTDIGRLSGGPTARYRRNGYRELSCPTTSQRQRRKRLGQPTEFTEQQVDAVNEAIHDFVRRFA